jgi:hypothetical protein
MFATLCSQSRRALLQGRLRWVTSIPDGDSFSSLRMRLVVVFGVLATGPGCRKMQCEVGTLFGCKAE